MNESEFMNAVTLSDGRTGRRCLLQVETREPSTTDNPASDSQPSTLNSQPVLDFIASTDTLDRYREIIDPAGWRLDSYRRNPVFQNAHNYGDVLFTIGKALITEVRLGASPHLYQRVQFASDVNPIARIAYGLYRGGFLNAVSVGFIPIRWEDGAPDAPFRRKYLEQELLEVSAVAIPANPDALALGLKAGAVQKAELQETAELLGAVIRCSADCQSAVSPTGSRRGREDEELPADCQSAIQPTDSRRYDGAASQLSPPGAGSMTFSSVSTLNPQLLLDFARELRRILRRA